MMPEATRSDDAPATSDGPLLTDRDGEVAILTLNRAAARNSLSESLVDALAAAFETITPDRTVKAIVLTGAPPAFCAGHDLREMTEARSAGDRGRAYFERIFAKCSTVMQAIVACPKPVIASVEGIATAAGCQLVATCDLAVAGESARFATPGVNIGLFCSTPMVALTRNVSPKHAMEMLLTGDMVSAGRAEQIGLINKVVATGDAMDSAMALARQIAAKSPLTVRTGKKTFYRQREMPLAEAYAYTARIMTENMLARDAEEGIGAFLDKRTPQWTGE
ncbi:enoyl-CoA hydratase [Microbaculum marinum]|uniref:Enoyl-CoA hydratase domain-containing protein 3, mitochondrial n=1 Tax=Microbaculum marinum TaxID=1764581 RepID=A0AAW9RVH6_9HYPH